MVLSFKLLNIFKKMSNYGKNTKQRYILIKSPLAQDKYSVKKISGISVYENKIDLSLYSSFIKISPLID